jgi:hypothetical protein
MTSNHENAALTNREPKARGGRCCFSPLTRHGIAQIGAGAAQRSLPKSDQVGGPRVLGPGGGAREMHLEVREPLVHRGTFEAGAARRSLHTSDRAGGPRVLGTERAAREMHLNARERLVHRGTFLAKPAPDAFTADDPRVSASRVWAPSARLRPCAVRSTAELALSEGAVIEAA